MNLKKVNIADKRLFKFTNKKQLNSFVINEINKKYSKRKEINYIISGGNSLKTLISNLGNIKCNQNIILSDERIVEIDSKNSNMNMLKKVIPFSSLKGKQIKLIELPVNLTKISKKNLLINMEEKIKKIKKIDFAILSIGSDGHFASIFDNKNDINNKNYLITRKKNETFSRITFSLNFFMNINQIYFIINNKKKIHIYKKIFNFSEKRSKNLPIINILDKRINNFDDKILVTQDLEK